MTWSKLTYMVDGMKFAAKPKYKNLVRQDRSNLVNRHLCPLGSVSLRDAEDFASWCGVSFAQQRLRDEIRERRGQADRKPIRTWPRSLTK